MPCCARGFSNIHFVHGTSELGRDFIARHDGHDGLRQYAPQSKAGDLNLAAWQQVRHQIEEIRTGDLSHPAFDPDLPRSAVLVTTGRLVGDARLSAQTYRERYADGIDFDVCDRDRLIEYIAAVAPLLRLPRPRAAHRPHLPLLHGPDHRPAAALTSTTTTGAPKRRRPAYGGRPVARRSRRPACGWGAPQTQADRGTASPSRRSRYAQACRPGAEAPARQPWRSRRLAAVSTERRTRVGAAGRRAVHRGPRCRSEAQCDSGPPAASRNRHATSSPSSTATSSRARSPRWILPAASRAGASSGWCRNAPRLRSRARSSGCIEERSLPALRGPGKTDREPTKRLRAEAPVSALRRGRTASELLGDIVAAEDREQLIG